MRRILVEAAQAPGDEFHEMTVVAEGTAPGAFVDLSLGEEHVLICGWVEGEVGVWRSLTGFEFNLGQFKGVNALNGLDKLSDLSEPYERLVMPEQGGLYRVRWTLAGNPPT